MTSSKSQKNSRKDNSLSFSGQEILHIVLNLKPVYSVCVYSPLVCIQGYKNAVHTFPHHTLKIYFNVVLSSTPSSYKCSVPLRIANQNLVLVGNIQYFTFLTAAICHIVALISPTILEAENKLEILSLCSVRHSSIPHSLRYSFLSHFILKHRFLPAQQVLRSSW